MHDVMFRFLSEMTALAGARPADIDDLIQDTSEVSAAPGEVVEPNGPVAVMSGGLQVRDESGRSIDMVGTGEFWVPTPGHTATAMSATIFLLLPDHAIDLAWEGDAGRTVLSEWQRTDGHDLRLVSRLVSEVMTPPLVVGGHTAAQAVAEAMTLEAASAALVTGGEYLGIVTDRDFRARMVAVGRDSSRPVRDIATFPVTTIESNALLVTALEVMVGLGVKHLPVLSGGRPVGMLTDSDLFGTINDSPFAIQSAIRSAHSPAALAEVYSSMPRIIERLLAEGMEGLAISRLLANFAESATGRAIEWTTAELGQTPGPFAWVAMGSIARREPALLPDQDHALVFPDGAGDESWYAGLGSGVTKILESVGYPRCNGGVMASEPEWRGTEGEWDDRWVSYLLDASPDHLLKSQIVFDSRVIAGDPGLADSFSSLRSRARGAGPFLTLLAKHASDFRPPLGFMGRLQTDRGGDHSGTFDLKAGAILPIVQFARIHALAIDAQVVDTIGRLEAAAAAGEVSAELASMLIEGYELATTIRLEHQGSRWRAGEEPDNRIDPGELTSWRRMGIREVFKAIKSAQESLALNYQSGLVSG
jgi:CBS domain-containing protein